MTNPVYELLTKAQNLIRDPDHWMQDISVNTGRTCFCALGALTHTCDGDFATASEARDAIRRANDITFISSFNDTHTHDEVMAMFDKARDYALDPAAFAGA